MSQIGGPLLLEGLDAVAAVEEDDCWEGSRTFRTDQQPPQRRPGLLLQLDPLSLGLLERKRGRRGSRGRELDPLRGRRGGRRSTRSGRAPRSRKDHPHCRAPSCAKPGVPSRGGLNRAGYSSASGAASSKRLMTSPGSHDSSEPAWRARCRFQSSFRDPADGRPGPATAEGVAWEFLQDCTVSAFGAVESQRERRPRNRTLDCGPMNDWGRSFWTAYRGRHRHSRMPDVRPTWRRATTRQRGGAPVRVIHQQEQWRTAIPSALPVT